MGLGIVSMVMAGMAGRSKRKKPAKRARGGGSDQAYDVAAKEEEVEVNEDRSRGVWAKQMGSRRGDSRLKKLTPSQNAEGQQREIRHSPH